MKKQISLTLLLALCSTILFAQKAPDTKQEDQPKESAPSTPKTQKVEDYANAVSLARYGYANNCAICLITAADIMYKTGVTALAADAKTNPTAPTSGPSKPEKPNPADPAQILIDARQMAKGNANLLALASQVKPVTSRGAVGGPKRSTTRVEAGDVDIYRISFYGGESAAVALRGDGDTDLDLYIYDENGNFITSDDDGSDFCIARWTPRYTGLFTIRVRNRGRVYNRYTMATN